jgi:release factor glutamine methyltransferase
MTVLEVIQSAAGYLEKNGVADARLNAEYLLAHALGKRKRLDLYLEFDRPLSDAERAPLRDLVRQRGQGIPLQHLLGSAEFFGRTFLCDGRGLIPRPETEQLVELVQAQIPNPKSKILDVGTGSGVLAITLALEFPEAEVHAVDVAPDALTLARENAAQLVAVERITFHQADLLPPDAASFDVIVANLPYIATDEIPRLSREVQRDPLLALDGGVDGLDLVRRLVSRAVEVLAPAGRIFLEVGHDQAQATADLCTAAGLAHAATHRDLQGVLRFATAQRPA